MAVTEIITLETDTTGAVTGIEEVSTAMENLDTATTTAEEATKSLKAQIRQATIELNNMSEDDPRRAKLIVQIGELRDRVSDTAEQIRQQTGPAIEGLNNSFDIMQGQMMNLDFAGLATSMQGVATNIGRINTAEFVAGLKSILAAGVDVFTQLGKVIMANPLLMIVGIVTAIIATFDKWKSKFPAIEQAISGINEEERKGLKIAEQKVAASSKAYENIQKTENILKLQGKSEREILQMKMEALQVDIANRKTQLAIVEKTAKTQIETAKRNKEIVMGIVGFLTAPLQLILYTVDQIAAFAGHATNLQKDFNDFAASFVVDPIEMETELNKTIQENKDAIRDMENTYAGLQWDIQEMDKKALQDKKKINEENKKEAKKDKEEAKKEAEQDLLAELDEWEHAKEREMDMAAEIESQGAEELLKMHQQKLDRDLQNFKTNIQQKVELKKVETKTLEDIEAKAEEIRRARIKKEWDFRIQQSAEALTVLADLNDAFLSRNDKVARKQFAVSKALNMAAAIMNTYGAVNKALNDETMPSTAARIVQAVIVGAAGFANVAKIAKTQYSSTNTGGGGGGGLGNMSAGGGNMPTAPAVDFGFLQQTGQPNTVETYVLAGNVANALEARQKIIDQSYL